MFRAAVLFLMLPLAFATGQDATGQDATGLDKTLSDASVERLPKFARARLGSTRFRFGWSAAYLRYSRNGQLLTAVDYDDFKGWDAETGELRFKLYLPYAIIAQQSDTTYLIARDRSSPLRQWDTSQADLPEWLVQLQKSYREGGDNGPDVDMGMGLGGPFGPGEIRSFAVASPSGQTVAVADLLGSAPSVVELKKVETGKSLDEMETVQQWRVPSQVQQLTFAPDGKQLAITGPTHVTLCDLGGGNRREQFKLPDGARNYVVSDDVTRVAFRHDNVITVRNLASGETSKLQIPQSETSLQELVWSPDGKNLYGGGKANTIWHWKIDEGPKAAALAEQPSWIESLAVSADGKTVASSTHRRINLFDCASGKCINEPIGHASGILSADISSDGSFVVTSAHDGTVRLWDVNGDREPKVLVSGPDGFTGCRFSPDDQYVAALSAHELQMINMASGVTLWKKPIPKGTKLVRSVGFSGSGDRVTALVGAKVCVWEADTGRMIMGKKTPKQDARATCLSPNGRLVAYASSGHEAGSTQIDVYDLNAKEVIRKLIPEKGNADVLRFSSDSRKLLVGGHSAARGFVGKRRPVGSPNHEDSVMLWDLPANRVLRRYGWPECKKFSRTALAVAFSRDHKYVFSGEQNGQINVYQSTTAKRVGILSGHINRITALSVSANGKWLLSASDDSSALVWDVDKAIAGMTADEG